MVLLVKWCVHSGNGVVLGTVFLELVHPELYHHKPIFIIIFDVILKSIWLTCPVVF